MDDNELQSKLFMSDKKITKGSLQGFRVIEPIWTYPGFITPTTRLARISTSRRSGLSWDGPYMQAG